MPAYRSNSCSVVVLFCALCILATGCGKYKIAPVSGVITLDNKPLEDATVTFTPQGTIEGEAPVSSGRTDAQGKYTLELVSDSSSGAMIGKHSVRIARNIESESDIMTPAEVAKSYLPPHDFTFDVVSGNNTADFNLESKSKR